MYVTGVGTAVVPAAGASVATSVATPPSGALVAAGAAEPQALRTIAIITNRLRLNHNLFVLLAMFMVFSPF